MVEALAAAPLVAAVEIVDGPLQVGLRRRDVSDGRPPRSGARDAGQHDHEFAGVRRRAGRSARTCSPTGSSAWPATGSRRSNATADEEFRVQFGESNINLFNFYRSYVQEPDRFEDIILPALATVAQVQEWGTQQSEPTLESVRDRILPMLYPEDVWRRSFPNFVANTWVGDLMVLYVVDEQHAYWYIRDDMLDRWKIGRDELHSLALSNLDAYFDRQRMEYIMAGEEGGPRLLMPKRPDAYNSSRILSRRFCSVLRDELGSRAGRRRAEPRLPRGRQHAGVRDAGRDSPQGRGRLQPHGPSAFAAAPAGQCRRRERVSGADV